MGILLHPQPVYDCLLLCRSIPFLCTGFRLGQPEEALGGLLDILGMCPSIGTGLCGLVVLDIWLSVKHSDGEMTQI